MIGKTTFIFVITLSLSSLTHYSTENNAAGGLHLCHLQSKHTKQMCPGSSWNLCCVHLGEELGAEDPVHSTVVLIIGVPGTLPTLLSECPCPCMVLLVLDAWYKGLTTTAGEDSLQMRMKAKLACTFRRDYQQSMWISSLDLCSKCVCFLNTNVFPLFHHVFLTRAPRNCVLSFVHL